MVDRRGAEQRQRQARRGGCVGEGVARCRLQGQRRRHGSRLRGGGAVAWPPPPQQRRQRLAPAVIVRLCLWHHLVN